MATATEERSAVTVLPFGIEADHPRNSDLLIQCIPGCRLRSAISGTKPCVDAKTGDLRVPRDQAAHLGSFPQTPGMQLHVDPAKLTYVIYDPLRENEDLCAKVTKYLREECGASSTTVIKGLPPLEGKLDVHRMKSLCREMVWLVNSKEAKKCKGVVPTLQDVEEMPGHFLLNPGARVQTTQPVYEKDFPDWVERLSHSGG